MTAAGEGLHPLLASAADDDRLPDWARCGPGRRAHAARVGDLLAEWAGALELSGREVRRWRATGLLHDALRGAGEEDLRDLAGRDWPLPVLHAPACAERLRREGVDDGQVLRAITYHPVGHPDFGALGDHLYAADFLEPGRDFRPAERADLRKRMPGDLREVLPRVIRLRLGHLLDRGKPLMLETVRYWNRAVEGARAG